MEAKPLDWKSLAVAAVAGAFALFIVANIIGFAQKRTALNTFEAIGWGGAIGAFVQVLVRLTGVS